LIWEGNNQIDAKRRLHRLKWEIQNTFKVAIENWTDNIETRNPLCRFKRLRQQGKYDCGIFEYEQHRVYGFFCRPKRDYELYVVVAYLPLAKWDKEENVCIRCEDLRGSLNVRRAIKEEFGRYDDEAE
jgi:hypothetical protein